MGKNRHREEIWQVVKKKYRLSREVINMAKQLGLNPKKFGGLAREQIAGFWGRCFP